MTRRIIRTFGILLGITTVSLSQGIQSFQIPASVPSTLPNSNSVSVLAISGDTLWAGTGNGLSFTTGDGSLWHHFAGTATFDDRALAAIAVLNNRIWTSVAFTEGALFAELAQPEITPARVTKIRSMI